MQHLDNIQEVGRGIAVAFVATIYGVGIANLFFLPFAGKMRLRMREDHQRREMMLEGVISILEGMNPRMLEVKLAGFVDDRGQGRETGARSMRARVPRSRVTQDRWLVSYADFITLLFGFFVVLYAFAKRRPEKADADSPCRSMPRSRSLGHVSRIRRARRPSHANAAGEGRAGDPDEYRDGRGCAFAGAR